MLSDSPALPYHPPSPANGLALAAGGDHPSGAGGAADPRMPGPETEVGANVTSKRHAKIAQLVEHRIVNPSVQVRSLLFAPKARMRALVLQTSHVSGSTKWVPGLLREGWPDPLVRQRARTPFALAPRREGRDACSPVFARPCQYWYGPREPGGAPLRSSPQGAMAGPASDPAPYSATGNPARRACLSRG